MSRERKKLGGWNSLVERNVVYQLPDAIEVESSQIFDVVRRRVFFDEVGMVTLHREYGPLFLILSGLYTGFFSLLGFIFLFADVLPASLTFFALASPGLTALLVRAIFGVDVVTVIGPRSRASVRYSMRKQRAREVYGALSNAVRDAHRRLEREYAEEAAKNAPPAVAEPPVDQPL